MIAGIVQKKCVVTMRGIDFGIRYRPLVFQQRAHDLARAGRRKTPVSAEGNQQEVGHDVRSEEHTSELQSLMRISYAVFCLKKKNDYTSRHQQKHTQTYAKSYKIK